MDTESRIYSKNKLDKIISKSRTFFYKPIQIAEILYHSRIDSSVNCDDIDYIRKVSKKWRDNVSEKLVGRICSSSSKFQDDLFNESAIPPKVLHILDIENKKTNGAIEAYIYGQFNKKHNQLANALDYCLSSTTDSFYVKNLLNSFWKEPGLKRSIDKVYEIIVYALFETLVRQLNLKVKISVDEEGYPLLREFSEFAHKIMCLDFEHPVFQQEAHIYRVGVTNAADRGLDMYSNWGPAIQIKHLSLDEELAEDIVTSIASDRIVIVCKDAEKGIILSLLTQIGWKSRIQSIVTENDLVEWYEKALRGKYSSQTGKPLLGILCEEIVREFPSVDMTIPDILAKRKYAKIHDAFWHV